MRHPTCRPAGARGLGGPRVCRGVCPPKSLTSRPGRGVPRRPPEQPRRSPRYRGDRRRGCGGTGGNRATGTGRRVASQDEGSTVGSTSVPSPSAPAPSSSLAPAATPRPRCSAPNRSPGHWKLSRRPTTHRAEAWGTGTRETETGATAMAAGTAAETEITRSGCRRFLGVPGWSIGPLTALALGITLHRRSPHDRRADISPPVRRN